MVRQRTSRLGRNTNTYYSGLCKHEVAWYHCRGHWEIKGLFGRGVWVVLFIVFLNICGWKSIWKCVKYCLKTENGCLKCPTKWALKVSNYLTTHKLGRNLFPQKMFSKNYLIFLFFCHVLENVVWKINVNLLLVVNLRIYQLLKLTNYVWSISIC